MYDEDTVFNMDETHFVINMDDGKTLALWGEKSIRYSDVVNGREGMTMVVKIRGGPSARLEIPMLIFHNKRPAFRCAICPTQPPV